MRVLRLWAFASASILIVTLGFFLSPPASGAALSPDGQQKNKGSFTLEQVLSAPFPTDLVTAGDADRIAWVFNSEGARNVWTAAAPDYEPVRLTSYAVDEVFELQDLAITRDGSTVVYVRGGNPNTQGWVTNPTSDPAGVEQAVWAVRAGGGSPWRVCFGNNPAVSPDGRWILVVKENLIYRAALRDPSPSGEAPAPELLFKAAGRNGQPIWSPDGTRIAFVSNRGEHSFVGVYDLAKIRITWLAPSVDRDSDPAWSPDGKRVAFFRQPGAQYNEKPDYLNPPVPSVWTADPETGGGQELWGPAGKDPKYFTIRNLTWAANGRLLFTAERDNWNHVYSLTPTAGATGTAAAAANPASEPLDLTPGEGEVEDFRPARDGAAIYYSGNQADIHGRHVFKVPAPGGKALPLTSGATIGCDPVPLANGKDVAFLQATARQPMAIAIVPAAGGASRVIAPRRLPEGFPAEALVSPELVIVKAPDGLDVPCQLFLPRGAKAGARLPGVVFVHGGPMRQMLLGWHYMEFYSEAYGINQLLANRGYAVISVNYRSGIGYGRSFRVRPDAGRRGASEYQDVLAGAKYLQARPEVDPDRVGIWGLSYGGNLTAMGLSRNSDIFKAGVDLAGVHDWSTSRGRAEQTPEERKLAFDSSPVAGVKTWTSPVLFIHGDDDRNVNFAQTVDLVQKLREKGGVHIELMVRPDEPHEFKLHRNLMDAYSATVEFLDRFLGKSPARSAAPADRFTDPEFWRTQALQDLIPYWAAHAPDPADGGFFMNLARDWKPLPPWDKVPALISRHVFGFSAAYLLSGDPQYLDIARRGAEYLYAHAWDPQYGGWFDKLARNGKPLVETKSVSLQLYTNVGLTGYYLASGDERALALVRKSVDIQQTKGFDAKAGGYVQALNRDLSVANYGKNKHSHYGYVGSLLLNLYLATGDPKVLAWERELADLSLGKMLDKHGWIHGFRSLFDRDWQRTPALVDNREVVSVGAELTAALAFLRLYHQTGERKYLDAGRQLGDLVTRWGFDRSRGCWYDLIETAPPHRPVARPTVWWWVQIYGSFLQLQLYHVTGDEACLDAFRKSEGFFDMYFRDREKGGVFGSVTPDGRVSGEGRKASDYEWHTSYHEMEHALLNYLYLNLYVNRTPAVLHYRLAGPATHLVSLVDDPAVRISGVTMDGQPWREFDAGRRSVVVPAGEAQAVQVTFVPAPR